MPNKRATVQTTLGNFTIEVSLNLSLLFTYWFEI